MAFLGAYFFAIYLLLRSYFRGDLRARIYNQITARLVTVVVVAYLINAILFPNTEREEIIWTLAFLAGVVPTTVLDRAMHAMGGIVKSVAGDTFAANRPLDHIDGIDVYDASRLEAEGIPDVAALAVERPRLGDAADAAADRTARRLGRPGCLDGRRRDAGSETGPADSLPPGAWHPHRNGSARGRGARWQSRGSGALPQHGVARPTVELDPRSRGRRATVGPGGRWRRSVARVVRVVAGFGRPAHGHG